MQYVDGFVLPVPKKNLKLYRTIAQKAGKIWRETDYFAPPFDPPSWRSPYVETEP